MPAILENFFVFHRSGKCLLSANYSERQLTPDFVQGLKSSSTTLFSFMNRRDPGQGGSKRHEDIGGGLALGPSTQDDRQSRDSESDDAMSELIISDMHFFFLELGVYMLIAQGARNTPPSVLSDAISAVRQTMKFYIGTFDNVSQDPGIFEGVADIIRDVLGRQTNLISFVNGVPCVPLTPRAFATLDRLLSSLEDNHNVYGSVMLIGQSVLHRRLEVRPSKMLLQHIMARPMRSCAVRSIPVFVDNRAQSMVLVQINSMTLCVFIHITAAFSELAPYLEHLEVNLEDDVYQLPKEEPPILLRDFTGLDTLAFLYYDAKSGKVVAPSFRIDGGRNEVVSQAFRWFFANAKTMVGRNSISQLTLTGDEYIYHHVVKGSVHLSVLYSTVVESGIAILTQEIYDNVRRTLHE